MPITFTTESILAHEPDIAVNTVNCVGVSGAGIAKLLASTFPHAARAYENACGRRLTCDATPGPDIGKPDTPLPACIAPGADCPVHRIRPGIVRLFRTQTSGTQSPGTQAIAALPTKRHWKTGSRLSDIDIGLAALARGLDRPNPLDPSSSTERSLVIAMPPPGCGHGGLDWTDVQPLIVRHLRNSRHRILCTIPR